VLKGKNAIVTGGAGSFGLSIAKTLADNGARIVILDLTTDKVASAVEKLSETGISAILGVACDVALWESVEEAFARIGHETGGVDVLVNNAGVREIAHPLELAPGEWDRVVGTNLDGPYYCSRAAGLQMRERGGGAIINIASVAGLIGIRYRSAYVASKHGLIGLTKSLACDLAEFNIRVNAVAPGLIRTQMTEPYFYDPVFVEGMKGSVPLKRSGTPQDIANCVLFLSSPLSEFITGVTIPVDGGYLTDKPFAPASTRSFFESSAST
jgi:NAD(P)-dependent dehydrogenase (short-subunit alcohol dehydrogenase family)